MAYSRETSVDASQGGDTIKEAILDLDTDLTNIFTNLNAHEALTEGVHGIGAGQDVVGTTETQTLENKTLTAPIINAGEVTVLTVLTVAQDTDLGNYIITAKIFESDVPQGTAPFIVASTTVVTNLNADLLDGKEGPSGSIVGTSDSQTLTNKTMTSPILNTGISGDAFLDEDNMATDSATKAASQQSIKAYMDTQTALYDAELQALTDVEVQQLQNIGATTISATQWGYLGVMDQNVRIADSPTFAGLTVDGDFAGTGFLDEDAMGSDSATKAASQQSIKAYVDGSVGATGSMVLHQTVDITADASFQFTGLVPGVVYIIKMQFSYSTAGGYTYMRMNADATNAYVWQMDVIYNWNGGGGPYRTFGYDAADDQSDLISVNKSFANGTIELFQDEVDNYIHWFASCQSNEDAGDYYTYGCKSGGVAQNLGGADEDLSTIEIHTSTGTMTGTASIFKIILGL
jgi:hypothetical protein